MATTRDGVPEVALTAPATGGGATPLGFYAVAGLNVTSLKIGGGQLNSAQLFNLTTSGIRTVKFYDKATPPNPGVDVPIKNIVIPAATSAILPTCFLISFAPDGVNFNNGLWVALTQGADPLDATSVNAKDLYVNFDVT
jgi:hypothetical protein